MKHTPMAPGARDIQRERRIAGSIPLRNARRRCPAGAAFASKTHFPNRGGQGDNKKLPFSSALQFPLLSRPKVLGRQLAEASADGCGSIAYFYRLQYKTHWVE